MTKLYRFFKAQLLLAVVLLSATLSFAQIVQVPAGCTVVSQGTVPAGTAANFVGDGGIVGMPDPGVGGNFAFTSPVGAVLSGAVTWKLRGDISTTNALSIPADPTSFYNAATQTASGNATNIISYNKSLRVTEGVAPSLKTWARSKGRVTVGYTVVVSGILTCGNSITFEIFKIFPGNATLPTQPTNIPKIVGPDCIEVGKPCTFSVDQVASDNAGDAIGFDSYYWNGIPAVVLGTQYFSADNSSVTFTPSTSATFIMKCSFGKLNALVVPSGPGPTEITGAGYNSSVTKAVGVIPTQSVFPTSGGNPATIPNVVLSSNPLLAPCVNTGVTSFTVYFTGSTGVWTAANTGWTVEPVQYNGANYYVKVYTPNNNPGELIQTVTNGTCPPVVFRYQVNRKFVSATIAPVGSTSVCFNANSTNNLFNVGSTGLENPTSWTLTSNPTGATGVTLAAVPATPNSTIAVNIASNATINTEYTLTANATSCAYSPANTSPNFYKFRVRPNTPTITADDGNACVPKNSTASKSFTCVASTGASYEWQFPAGWGTGAAVTTTTNTITVTPSSSTAVLDGTVTVTANGIATCNAQATFTIGYTATAPTGVAASCWSTGIAGVHKVTFNNPLPGTYGATLTAIGSTVNLISGAVILSGTNILTFNTTNILTAGEQYNITITHTALNGCTPAAASSTTLLTVTAGGSIAVTPNPGAGNQDTFIASGGNSYQWYVNNVLIPSGTNTPTINCNFGVLSLGGNGTTPPTSVFAIINTGLNTCTTKATANLAGVTHTTNRQANNSSIVKTIIEEITIYPNPNNGIFTIKLDKIRLLATATLKDATGKEIATYILKKGENKIEKEGLSSGTYSIVLEVDGKTETRQLIIK